MTAHREGETGGSRELSPLQELMAADAAAGQPAEAEWREFVEHVVETLDVGPGTSVWDVSRAGAFLYPVGKRLRRGRHG
jgi:hypothetical protein